MTGRTRRPPRRPRAMKKQVDGRRDDSKLYNSLEAQASRRRTADGRTQIFDIATIGGRL